MTGTLLLELVALVGFVTTVLAGSTYVYRTLPAAFPRNRTRLDPRSYRAVRLAVSVGLVVGLLGSVLSLVDTAGSIRAAAGDTGGLLAGLAILIPGRVASALVLVGVGLLVGAALLAAGVEVRNALR